MLEAYPECYLLLDKRLKKWAERGLALGIRFAPGCVKYGRIVQLDSNYFWQGEKSEAGVGLGAKEGTTLLRWKWVEGNLGVLTEMCH